LEFSNVIDRNVVAAIGFIIYLSFSFSIAVVMGILLLSDVLYSKLYVPHQKSATATHLNHTTTSTWNFYILKAVILLAALGIVYAQVSAQSNHSLYDF
jgi:hypothetical protein